MQCYKRFLAIVFALLVALMSMQAVHADSTSAREGIEATNAELIAALAKGDAAGVAATYTAEAQMLQPNGETLRGRAAIQALWRGWIEAGFTQLTLQPIEIEAMGDTAYELGNYVSTDGKITDKGKYVVIWKRQQGKWRLHRDIWNTDLPAEQQ